MELKLRMDSSSCEDYILYYDNSGAIGFEAQFDNYEFNGIVSFCKNIGDDEEIWYKVEDKDIYCFIKDKAIEDFNKIQ